jgi:hypothetical protein
MSQDNPDIHKVIALDAATGTQKWQYQAPDETGVAGGQGGLLSTAGGLVFGSSEEYFSPWTLRPDTKFGGARLGGTPSLRRSRLRWMEGKSFLWRLDALYSRLGCRPLLLLVAYCFVLSREAII